MGLHKLAVNTAREPARLNRIVADTYLAEDGGRHYCAEQ